MVNVLLYYLMVQDLFSKKQIPQLVAVREYLMKTCDFKPSQLKLVCFLCEKERRN